MARADRLGGYGGIFHVTHRCHHREFLLKFALDRDSYRAKLRDHLQEFDVALLDYCALCLNLGRDERSGCGRSLMATMLLPPEFKRLLSALASNQVEYLLVGGYAVIYHGYVRTTGDIDIWVALNSGNAARLEATTRSLGYYPTGLTSEWFLRKGSDLRIGQEPLQFDIINDIDGVNFAECYARRIMADIDGVRLNVIALEDLKTNKKASGRNKDIADMDYLP